MAVGAHHPVSGKEMGWGTLSRTCWECGGPRGRGRETLQEQNRRKRFRSIIIFINEFLFTGKSILSLTVEEQHSKQHGGSSGWREPSDSKQPGQDGGSPGSTQPGQDGESPGSTQPGQDGGSPGSTQPGRTAVPPHSTQPGRSGEPPGFTELSRPQEPSHRAQPENDRRPSNSALPGRPGGLSNSTQPDSAQPEIAESTEVAVLNAQMAASWGGIHAPPQVGASLYQDICRRPLSRDRCLDCVQNLIRGG